MNFSSTDRLKRVKQRWHFCQQSCQLVLVFTLVVFPILGCSSSSSQNIQPRDADTDTGQQERPITDSGVEDSAVDDAEAEVGPDAAQLPCIPSCDDHECGDDGCGGLCGPGCAENEACSSGVCVGFGWTLLRESMTRPARHHPAIAFDRHREQLLLFGGRDEWFESSTETWEFDGEEWTLRDFPLADRPQSSSTMVYDSARGRVVLFTSTLSDTSGESVGSTWIYDGDRWEQIELDENPPPRASGDLVYDSHRDRVVLIVGRRHYPPSEIETWEFDGEEWTEILTDVSPPYRINAGTAYDPRRRRVVIFGGYYETQETFENAYRDDLWEFDGTSWVEREFSVKPSPRAGAQMVYDETLATVVLYGGWHTPDFLPEAFLDTWLYDGERWERSTPHPLPYSRSFRLVYDTARARTLAYGGGNYRDPWSDLWLFDGREWNALTHGAPPGARADAMSVYDWDTHRIVVLCGRAEGGVLPNVWHHDGSTWTHSYSFFIGWDRERGSAVYDRETGRIIVFGGLGDRGYIEDGTLLVTDTLHSMTHPDPSPPDRHSASMVFDSERDLSVLFGGTNDSVSFNDTWLYSGLNERWTEVESTISPPTRHDAAMIFDRRFRRTLVFGGQSQDGEFLGDTWVLEGDEWRELETTGTPPPRAGAAVVFDDFTGRVVLFGGEAESGVLADTWELDDDHWRHIETLSAPPPRRGAIFENAPFSGWNVLFGGQNDEAHLGDTWVYQAR